MQMMDWKIDFDLFDAGGGAGGGAGSGGAAASGGAQGGADAGASVEAAAPINPNRRKRENPLAHVRYGKQDNQQEQTQPAEQVQ